MYFKTRFNHYKNDIRNTWNTKNEILSINNANKTISFKINGITITDKTVIANQFNNYFTTAYDFNYNGNRKIIVTT